MKASFKIFAAAAAAILMFNTSSVQAQVSSGNVTVSFVVIDLLLLVVNPAPVPLTMATLSDYQVGTSYDAAAQLTASSNQPYDIKVKADGDMHSLTTSNTIPINQIAVQAKPTLGGAYSAQKNLTTSDQILLSNESSALAKIYDVKYSLTGNNAAFFVKGGIYTSIVTYSISAH